MNTAQKSLLSGLLSANLQLATDNLQLTGMPTASDTAGAIAMLAQLCREEALVDASTIPFGHPEGQ